MSVTDVNATLAIVVIAGSLMGLAVWVSPEALHKLAGRLYARACALRASRNSYRETHKLAMRLGVVAGSDVEAKG